MGGCFLFGTFLFGNFYVEGWGMGATGIGYTQNYEVLGDFSFFLAVICFIMALLEPKRVKEKNGK
mgnify:FL=1